MPSFLIFRVTGIENLQLVYNDNKLLHFFQYFLNKT